MRPENEECINEMAGRTSDIPPAIQPLGNVSEILRVSQRVEQFVNDNGWSWCMMDRVYRVLKSAHQG